MSRSSKVLEKGACVDNFPIQNQVRKGSGLTGYLRRVLWDCLEEHEDYASPACLGAILQNLILYFDMFVEALLQGPGRVAGKVVLWQRGFYVNVHFAHTSTKTRSATLH